MATEIDLQDNEPREVLGVKGMQSKPFRKRFRNAQAMDRWLDANADDITVQYIQKV